MRNPYRQSHLHRFPIFLCLISFTVTLWLDSSISEDSLNQQYQLSINWQGITGRVVKAESPDASQLIEKGLQLYEDTDITAAIKEWEQALSILRKNSNNALAVVVRENLARAYQETRQGEQAINYWKEVIVYYRQVGNQEKVGRSLTELAQVYSSLGQTKEALVLLCNPDKQDNCSPDSAVEIANSSKDKLSQVTAWGSLGDVNRLMGDYDKSLKNLEKSLGFVKKINNPGLQMSVLNSLGNTYISLAKVSDRKAASAKVRGDEEQARSFTKQAQQNETQALEYLHQSLDIARKQQDVSSQMRSLLRIIPLYWRDRRSNEAEVTLKSAIDLLESLPYSRSRVYATIDIVHLMHLLQTPTDKPAPSRWSCINSSSYPQEISLLETAVKVAKKIKDDRAESFALGTLGHIHECRQDYSQAIEITNQARIAAEQKLKAQDSLYLWEWQTGRILKAQGQISGAISAYEQATKTLDTIRQDILTANRDIQFDFRDTIEPIYRELVTLRVDLEESRQARNKSLVSEDDLNNISNILKTVDSLKLAELQNYFGNDCIITPFQEKTIQELGDSKTAFLNTIILADKTVVVLTLPNGVNKLETIKISRQSITEKILLFRRSLEQFRDEQADYDTTIAQEMYNWLVKPFITEIKNSKIKTLVFVQDGILRSIPMAALYDGEQFLIQQYAVATIPSINLTDVRPLQKQNLRILALGLSQPSKVNGKFFKELNNV
ncbi:MAG: CHAT domain-containing protein, partial [Scytonema sp. PMC 1069.18]|nr:CHAT domain-containing protein [Scytonema sp. PMC 1069.18]